MESDETLTEALKGVTLTGGCEEFTRQPTWKLSGRWIHRIGSERFRTDRCFTGEHHNLAKNLAKLAAAEVVWVYDCRVTQPKMAILAHITRGHETNQVTLLSALTRQGAQ